MNIIIQEAQLYSINKNVNQQLVIKLIVNPEDYDSNLEDQLYLSSKNKDTFTCALAEFQDKPKEVDSISKKRSDLAFLMLKYAEKENINIESEKKRIYDKYTEKYGFKVTSRSLLLEEDLDKEIASFNAGLEYN